MLSPFPQRRKSMERRSRFKNIRFLYSNALLMMGTGCETPLIISETGKLDIETQTDNTAEDWAAILPFPYFPVHSCKPHNSNGKKGYRIIPYTS